jgi:DNA-binding response OmpR family regulator
MSSEKHILIVDDEPNVRLVFRTALQSADYTLSTADNGDSALRWTGETQFDLILLDLQMPGMNGMDVLRKLRAGNNDVPVVIVTAHGSVPDAVEAMKLGAIDFLRKPLSPDELRNVVAEVLARHAPEPEAKPSPPRPDPEPASVESQFSLHLIRAKRALNRRAFDAAEIFLKQAIGMRPDSAEAHNLMGVLHEMRNNHDASYKEYRAALKHDRHYEPAKHNMQRYYERFTFGHSDVPVDTGH